jgi:hypothetical protein
MGEQEPGLAYISAAQVPVEAKDVAISFNGTAVLVYTVYAG